MVAWTGHIHRPARDRGARDPRWQVGWHARRRRWIRGIGGKHSGHWGHRAARGVDGSAGCVCDGTIRWGKRENTFARTYADVIWTGETHLIAVGVTACADNGAPCASAAMNILRI